ncbi:hypothetical protein [Microcoleus anatoxicus]|uniref:hypothetical protein n=1 Tax=Microcoleus anatoxicus TaxID=2705319 RepID=UPI00366D6528
MWKSDGTAAGTVLFIVINNVDVTAPTVALTSTSATTVTGLFSVLYGDLGNDSLIGGSGNDIFVLKSGQGFDTIGDFTVGQDLIGLSGGLSFSQLAISQNTQGTLIKNVLTGQELGVMVGVSANGITSANFRLI